MKTYLVIPAVIKIKNRIWANNNKWIKIYIIRKGGSFIKMGDNWQYSDIGI